MAKTRLARPTASTARRRRPARERVDIVGAGVAFGTIAGVAGAVAAVMAAASAVAAAPIAVTGCARAHLDGADRPEGRRANTGAGSPASRRERYDPPATAALVTPTGPPDVVAGLGGLGVGRDWRVGQGRDRATCDAPLVPGTQPSPDQPAADRRHDDRDEQGPYGHGVRLERHDPRVGCVSPSRRMLANVRSLCTHQIGLARGP